MKALVVDDLLLARRLISNHLRSFGIEDIIEAVDGIDALEKLKEQKEKVDIIITDWLMPNMNGLDLVIDLKKIEGYKDVPILMVTALDEKDDVIKALRHGVNGYISKPFEPDIFKKKVEDLLHKTDDYLINK